uniref:Glycosyl transferase 64 domain-containing protein n=1 Tax=Grammatophora oceanica TaxID=210454 RepID=A0A7S1Y4X3_9STRA
MPRSIYDKVAQNFNCEDIAMSFLVSSLSTPPPTSSIVKPPLLADFWAVRSMIKLYTESKISAGSSHKAIRDECVDEFATTLGLKGKLHHAKLKHSDNYEYGDRISIITTTKEQQPPPPRQVAFQKLLETWKHDMSKNEVVKQWTMLKAMASKDAYLAGLLEGTDPWKERWKHKGSKEEVAPPEEQEDEEGHKEGDLVLPHVDVIVEEEGETR